MDIDACVARIAEQKGLISKAENALEIGRFEQAKRERRAEIARLEAEREALGHELKEIQAGMERRAKVGVMRASYDEKRKTIDNMCVASRRRSMNPPLTSPVNGALRSVAANSDAYRSLTGKVIDERMMDRFVSAKVRELEDEVRAKTAERAEIDRRVATQKANLKTERDRVQDKAQEVAGAVRGGV